jgi:predicted AAA+ superfamily ATPase
MPGPSSGQLREIIADQRDEVRSQISDTNVIEREVPSGRLMGFLAVPNILAILGIRRCGKSVLSHLLLRGRSYGHVNFDDEKLAGLPAEGLNDVLEAIYRVHGKTEYILLDEPQNVKGWELLANRLRRTSKVIITGSNAHLLSGELSTHLTGRYIDFTLHPFSFREYLDLTKTAKAVETTVGKGRVRERLSQYLELGGFPEAYSLGKPMIRRIYGDIIAKDVVNRFRPRHFETLREMARYLVSNSGNEMTYSKLKNIFTLKRQETSKNYVSYLRDCLLLLVLERYSPKLKEHSIAPKKAYCADTGIVKTIGFRETQNLGSTYENAVAVELFRRRSYFSETEELYYWKDHSGREVDFVIKDGPAVKQLIQVTYQLDPDVKRREMDALLRASEQLSCKNLLLINDEEEEDETVHQNGRSGKVTILPLWKWLLTPPPRAPLS